MLVSRSAPPTRETILAGLKGIVQKLTGAPVEAIGIHTNYLDAGVDSLLLLQASRLVEERFGVRPSLAQLLEEYNTLGELAAFIEKQGNAGVEEPARLQSWDPAEDAKTEEPVEREITRHNTRTQAVPEPSKEQPVAAAPRPSRTLAGSSPTEAGSSLERLLRQQLEVMARQLELVRGSRIDRSEGTAGAPAPASAPAAPVYPEFRSPATPSAIEVEPFVPYRRIEAGSDPALNSQQRQYIDDLVERVTRRTPSSKRYAEQYRSPLADARTSVAFRLPWKEMVYPIVGDRAKGSRITDIDGNEYLDITMGFGVHLFGHSPEFLQSALREQIERGWALGPQARLAGANAELISQLTGCERVSFCNSGTEAVVAAVRAARTRRKRDKVALFGGAYHGWSDLTLGRTLGRGPEQRTIPVAPGISPAALQDVIILDYGSPESLQRIEAEAGQLAAVLVEPIQSRRPSFQPRDYLHELRRLTQKRDVALIFDETITGFRSHPGGVQALFGIPADVVVYGKVIGGGLPLGVVAGRKEFLDSFDGGAWSYGDASHPRADRTLFAGAFFKHPLTMAATHAVLTHLLDRGPALQSDLNARCAAMAELLNREFDELRAPIRVSQFSSLFRFDFDRGVQHPDLFLYQMLEKGVFIWEGRNCFLSTAHSEADIDRVVNCACESARQMESAGFLAPRRSAAPSPPAPAASSATPRSAVAAAEPVDRAPAVIRKRSGPEFSICFFGGFNPESAPSKYSLILEASRLADARGFSAVWLPERHFDVFAGFSPNPSVLGAAIAAVTRRIHIRAGSVVLPLHNPIRVAEEWSIVDNISGGRAGISFACGWHPLDFVFAPSAYESRREIMIDGIETLRRLWRGESVVVLAGSGLETEIRLMPPPRNPNLPIWLTGSSESTYKVAGKLGFGVLTNLKDDVLSKLGAKVGTYKEACRTHGGGVQPRVTLQMHTFVAPDDQAARKKAKEPLRGHFAESMGLLGKMRNAAGREQDTAALSSEQASELLDYTASQYIEGRALIGSPETCARTVEKIVEAGVDEIACLVDFGLDNASVLEGLESLDSLRQRYAPTTLQALSKRPDPEPFKTAPIGETEQQLWAISQLSADASRAHNDSMTIRFHGALQIGTMRAAIQRLVDRHEALRTTFYPDGSEKRIASALRLDIPMVDLTGDGNGPAERDAEQWIAREAREPFDLHTGPLLRARILKLSDLDYALVLTNHHVISDGQSGGVLLKELAALYSAAVQRVPVELPATVAAGRIAHAPRAAEAVLADEEYWTALFTPLPPPLEWPQGRPRPSAPTYAGERVDVVLSADVVQAVKRLGTMFGCTNFMTLFGAFELMLHQITGQDDLVIGINAMPTPADGKGARVGYHLNPLALRRKISRELDCAGFFNSVQRAASDAHEHQEYPIARILRKLRLNADFSRRPLVSAVFNLDNASAPPQFADLTTRLSVNPNGGAKSDVYWNVTRSPAGLRVECDYNTDLLDESSVRQLVKYFEKLILAIAANPKQRLTALSPYGGQAADPAPGPVPLSTYQSLIWAGQELHAAASMYSNAVVIRLRTEIDPEKFRAAFGRLIQASDALRTVVEDRDGVAAQHVLTSLPFALPFIDLSAQTEPDARLQTWLDGRFGAAFNLSVRCFDSVLFRFGTADYRWYLNLHHIISDGWTLGLIVGLVSDFYELPEEAATPVIPQFADYLNEEREMKGSGLYRDAEAYWNAKLAEPAEPIHFYGRHSLKKSDRVVRLTLGIGQERTRQLVSLAGGGENPLQDSHSSLFAILGAVLCAWLNRTSGARSISLGVPVHNRRSHSYRETVGLFMQILPVRLQVSTDDSLSSLARKFKTEFAAALRHYRYPTGNRFQAAYDIEFNYMSTVFPPFRGVPVQIEWLHGGAGLESMALQIHDFNGSGELVLNFDFHEDVIDDEMRSLSTQHFLTILDEMAARPAARIREIEQGSLREVRVTSREIESPSAMTIEEPFRVHFGRQARATPDRIAVISEEGCLSYAGLDAAAADLSATLSRLGVVAGSAVPVLAPRGTGLLTAMLAIMRCDACYIPLDPLSPPARLAEMIRQCGCQVAIAADEMDSLMNQTRGCLGDAMALAVCSPSTSRGKRHSPVATRDVSGHLAYIIYTSGSTGIPKGAMVHSAGMMNHLIAKVQTLGLTQEDVIAQTASQAFDISIWQFLSPLIVGACVRIFDHPTARDPALLFGLLERDHITVAEVVPSLLGGAVELLGAQGVRRPSLSMLRWLMTTGEAAPPSVCTSWLLLYPAVPLVNAYGPTECSDDVTQCVIREPFEARTLHTPIGEPLPNVHLYVVDNHFDLAPAGISGELAVGGIAVGCGYVADPARTAQSFMPDAFGRRSGGRIYRTGDYVRYGSEGLLEFLGRIDQQIKIRGYRIELAEIEAAAGSHGSIGACAAVVAEAPHGEKRIALYLSPRAGSAIDETGVREFLRTKLPDYMIPSVFVLLDALPLGPNGKIDRKSLPDPDIQADAGGNAENPRNHPERVLAAIWSQVLRVRNIGIHDNFFELGGDSILSIQVAAKAARAGLSITGLQIFEHQTVAELASAASKSGSVLADQGRVVGPAPLTPIQHWFFDCHPVEADHFNQSIFLETPAGFNPNWTRQVLAHLIEHHDALRTRFINTGSGWKQVFLSDSEVPFSLVDLSQIPESGQRGALEGAAARVQSSLDLAVGPMLRVIYFDLGAGKRGRLLFVVHHLATDAVSWQILLEDMQSAHQQAESGLEIALPAKTTSVKAWGERLERYARSEVPASALPFWLDSRRNFMTAIPRDGRGEPRKPAPIETVTLRTDAKHTMVLLQDVPTTHGVRMNDVLLTALAIAVSRWTGQPYLLLDLEGHGRDEPFEDVDLSRTVGWFTRIAPALLEFDPAADLRATLKIVSRQSREIVSRGLDYGVLRYLAPEEVIRERLAAMPRPEISFNYLGQIDRLVPAGGVYTLARESRGPSSGDASAPSHLIEINSMVLHGQLRTDWVYWPGIHDPVTIRRVAGEFQAILEAISEDSLSSLDRQVPNISLDSAQWSQADLDAVASAVEKAVGTSN